LTSRSPSRTASVSENIGKCNRKYIESFLDYYDYLGSEDYLT